MKLKYTLGALVAAFALAGCSLDVNMYDGVTGEDVTARNIVELSQGSYSMLKYDGGLIDYGYYFWAYGADDLSWGGTSTDEKFDIYDYSRKITSSVTEYAWELGYRTIGNCNRVVRILELMARHGIWSYCGYLHRRIVAHMDAEIKWQLLVRYRLSHGEHRLLCIGRCKRYCT